MEVVMQKTMLYIAGMIFVLVAIAHVVRLLLEVEILINGWVLPLWVSLAGSVVPAILAWLCFRAAKTVSVNLSQ